MIKGKTTTGFSYQINPDILDDYELLEEIAEIDTNPLVISKIVTKLLGKEQMQLMKEHVRNEAGIVGINAMTQEIIDIFQNSKETKNS